MLLGAYPLTLFINCELERQLQELCLQGCLGERIDLKLDVYSCLMLKSAPAHHYLCVCVCKILSKTLLCFNRIFNIAVNIRGWKNYEQKNTQRSYPDCSRERQRNEIYGREGQRHGEERVRRFTAQ